jgi:uncharacterized delta-60 repeat protein
MIRMQDRRSRRYRGTVKRWKRGTVERWNGGTNIIFCIVLLTCLIIGISEVFAAGGDIIWEYGVTPQSGKQEAKAMAVDSSGNVIITGFSSQGGNDDYYTVKIAADGTGVLWSAEYDGTGGNDYATAIALDSDDNVIVTGYTWNGSNYDIHTVKYDGETGAVLWENTLSTEVGGNDYATAVVVDSLNNVYVGGFVQGSSGKDDFIVIKYGANGPNPDGTPIWQVSYNGVADGHDRILSIAAGVDGIVVTGESQNSTPDFDILTIKYGLDGALIWQMVKSASGDDEGKAVRMDSSGNVIMAGYVYNGANRDIYIAKYDSTTGAILWEQTYDGGYDEEPADLFVDSFDDVYITGYSFTLDTANDIYTAKYNGSTGTLIWSDLFNTSNGNNDKAVCVVVDEAGDMFVAGNTFDETLSNYNFQILKYTKDTGSLLWQRSYDGAGGKDDRSVGVGLTPAGEPIIAGWTDMWTGGASDYDYYAIKYDPGLLNPPTDLEAVAISTSQIDLTWTDNSSNEDGFKIERKTGDFGTYAEIATVPADTTTYSDTGLTADTKYYYRVRAYNSTEGDSHYSNEAYAVTTIVSFTAPPLVYTYDGADGGDDYVSAVGVGPDNNPVVTGYSYSLLGQFDYYTLKLDKDTFGLIWDARYDSDQNDMDMAKTIVVDMNNDVLVSGTSYLYSAGSGENTNDIYSIRYPSTGPPEDWSDQYNGPAGDDDRSSVVDVSKDGSNNYVVVGYGRNANWDDDIYVIKYLSDGTRQWEATPYDGGVFGHDYPSAVAFDANGDIFVAGYTSNGSNYDYFVAKYNGSDGTIIWSDVYNGAGDGNDYARSLAIDSAGNVYVTGSMVTASGNEDFYTIKYDGTNGTKLWERAYNGLGNGIDEAIAVRVDPVNGDVVVAGTTLAGVDNNEFHVIRYDSDGNVVWERTLDRPTTNEFVVAMEMDISGNVYVVGDTITASDSDVIVVQYDHEGCFIGGTEYNGSAGDNDGAEAVGVNTIGEAFVGGYTVNTNGNTDYLVFKVQGDDLQVPTPFNATSPDYTQIDLQWTDNATGEDGYRLERKVGGCASTNSWVLIYEAPANTTTYSDTGLNIGAEYCYRIQAYNNNGSTSRWVEKAAMTLSPEAPSDLAGSYNSTEVNLRWTDNTINETGFVIERCEGATCDFSVVIEFTVGTDVSSFLDDTVCESTTYRYRVKAYKSGEWTTDYSNVISVTTSSISAPTNLTASRISEVEIGLVWEDNTGDESGFIVERCTGDVASCTQDTDFTYSLQVLPPYDVSPSILLHMDESLWDGTVGEVRDSSGGENHGTAYGGATTVTGGKYGRAGSFDGVDDYLEWSDDSFLPRGTGSEMTIAFWFKHTTLSSGGTIIEQWDKADGNDKAWDVIATTDGRINFRINNKGSSEEYTCSGVRTGLDDGSWHHFVGIYDEGSGNIDTYIDGVIDCDGTTTYVLGSDNASSHFHIGAKKNGATYESFYNGFIDEVAIYDRTLTPTEIQNIYNNVISAKILYSDTSVESSTTYTYRVKAYKNANCPWETGYSNTASATTTIIAPDGLTASTVSTTQIYLSWIDNTVSETGFIIERCEGATCDFSTGVTTFTVGADVTAYSDTSACENTSYRYRVKAEKTLEWESGYSNEASATTEAKAAPTELTATAISESQVDLTWTDNTTDETGFKVERCTGDGCSDFGLLAIVLDVTDSVAYWRFDEGSGTMAYDTVGENNGTINGATWTPDSKSVYALNFDGNNNITVPNFNLGSTTALTVEAWVKRDLVGGDTVISQWTGSWGSQSNDVFRLTICGSSNCGCGSSYPAYGLMFYIASGNMPALRASSSAGLITDNQWHHIVGVFEASSRMDVYLDGQKVNGVLHRTSCKSISVPSSINNITKDLIIGSSMNGIIDEVVIYNRALSDAEVLERYQQSSSLIRSYSDTGLNPGTSYTYRVKAYKDTACGWETVFTNTASATTLLPPAPSDLTASVINTTQIDLSWTDNTDTETSFRIQRCEGINCDFSSVTEFIVGADVSAYSDTSVCESTIYRYRVRAEKNDGPVWETDWATPTSNVTTPASTAPGNLIATKINESQIDLEWIDNTDDETGFKIERCIGEGCTDFVLLTTIPSVSGNVLLLHMDESSWNGTPGEVIDSSDSGNHGTAYNGANTVAEGKFGRAGSFDGSNDYVDLGNPSSLQITGSQTIEMWVKPVDFGARRNPYAKAYGGEGTITIEKNGTVNYYYGTCGGNCSPYQGFTMTSALQANTWTHLAIVRDLDNMKLRWYKNGVLTDETNALYSSAKASSLSAFIGRGYVGNFKGLLDEVAVYNRALSQSEIQSHYNRGVSATRYTDSGLSANETYRYRVYAYKEASCGWATGYSNEAEDVTTPPPPTDLTATAVDTTQIDLNWTDNNATETGFKVERCEGAGCSNFVEIDSVGADVSTYSDTTVCEDRTYSYRVKAYKSGEWETAYSNEVSTTTPAITAPSGLSVVRVSEIEVSLSWSDNTIDESGFKVERCEGAGCSDFVEIGTVGADVNTYNDVGLSPEQSYTYRVRAYKVADCGWSTGYSNTDTATTNIVGPSDLVATAINTTQIDLSWSDNSASETIFKVERCEGAGCSDFVEIDTVEADTTRYSDTTVCNSTTYTYRIKGQKEGVLSNSGGGCWIRRVPLTINDFQSNYQTMVTINYDGDMQMDFGDIRFYDERAGVELPYWIESKTDGVSATVYFKTLGDNVYMYYGNLSATSSSNGEKTFDLYDPANTGINSEFTKASSNPVLNLGAGGTWDDTHIYGSSVIRDSDGTYKMWYSGHDGSNLRIGYATSSDGINWSKYSGNPVLDLGAGGSWESTHVGYPVVMRDSDGTYKMWYAGHDGSTWRIGYATSSDGINWNKYSGNPVLNLGAGGSWDDAHVLTGKVIKENGIYKMWYSGHNGSNWRIGYATSSDGINWSKYSGNPVLNLGAGGSWDDAHVYISSVIKDRDGTYKMWYTGHSGSNTRIGYATSSDGINWSKYSGNPVLNLGAGGSWDDVHVYGPMVMKDGDGRYRLWYAGHDGSNWRIGYGYVQPRKTATPEPSVLVGAEEESVCYSFGTWETGYSNEASATTFTLSAPTDLLAIAVTDVDTELTWTDNSMDETGFKIERCEGIGCSDFVEVDIVGEGITIYRDTGVNPETTYCYRVRGYKDAVCGWDTGYSNESCDLTFSARPSDLVATAINSMVIRLDWTDNANDEEGYEVEVQIFNGKFVRIATVGANVTTFTDTMGIEPEKEYRYRVRAFRGEDKTPYSNEAAVITPAWQEGDTTCVE